MANMAVLVDTAVLLGLLNAHCYWQSRSIFLRKGVHMLFVSVAVRVCVCVVGSLVIVMSGIKKCQSHAWRS